MANKTDERLLDSFREASGSGASGADELPGMAEEIAGALKDALWAGVAPDPATGAAPGQAGATGQAQPGGMTHEAGGAAGATAQEQAKAVMDALLAGMTQEAAGTTAAAPQWQGAGDVYGESATSAGSGYYSSTNSSSSGTSSGSSTASNVASTVETYMQGGGLISLIPKIIGWIRGGNSAPPVLEKYAMPESISFESGETGSGLSASDFDQMGAPRLYGSPADSPGAAGGAAAASASYGGQNGGTSGSGGNAAAPQISVTVQTMDAQSFLDNSEQIARAVRGAMLNLSSINDVVGEL